MPPPEVSRFLTDGYTILRDVLSPAELQRARGAFDRGAAEATSNWERTKEKGKDKKDYIGLGNIFDIDDIFIEWVSHPVTFPVVREAIGEDVHLENALGAIYLPGADTFRWHWDTHAFRGISIETSPRFRAKLHYYLSDVPEDRGCLGYVPGSHLLPTRAMPEVERLEDMPGHVRLPMTAGDALLINVHGWHTVFPNTSDQARKSVIYIYSHSWMKRDPKCRPSRVERVMDDPVKRHLFGLGEDKGYKGTPLPPIASACAPHVGGRDAVTEPRGNT